MLYAELWCVACVGRGKESERRGGDSSMSWVFSPPWPSIAVISKQRDMQNNNERMNKHVRDQQWSMSMCAIYSNLLCATPLGTLRFFTFLLLSLFSRRTTLHHIGTPSSASITSWRISLIVMNKCAISYIRPPCSGISSCAEVLKRTRKIIFFPGPRRYVCCVYESALQLQMEERVAMHHRKRESERERESDDETARYT